MIGCPFRVANIARGGSFRRSRFAALWGHSAWNWALQEGGLGGLHSRRFGARNNYFIVTYPRSRGPRGAGVERASHSRVHCPVKKSQSAGNFRGSPA